MTKGTPDWALMAIVSTGHVTRGDIMGISRITCSWRTAKTEYGVILWLPSSWREEEEQQARSLRLSIACQSLLKRLIRKKARYVYFDRDGPVVRGWPTFAW